LKDDVNAPPATDVKWTVNGLGLTILTVGGGGSAAAGVKAAASSARSSNEVNAVRRLAALHTAQKASG
jgi:hypothetical protein